LKLHNAVTWHASTAAERFDIQRVFGETINSFVAIDLRTGLTLESDSPSQNERSSDGQHRNSLVLLSRIVPVKCVTVAIEAMNSVKGEAELTIAGPIEDANYWDRCLELINGGANPEAIRYAGAIAAEAVVEFLSQFDLFVFPTLGESYGHVVLESLAAGTPVLIGDNTPWGQIERSGAGWLCDTTKPEAIAERIDHFLSLDQSAHERMRKSARKLALEVLTDPVSLDATRSMFNSVTRPRLPESTDWESNRRR
jgi:glycosyltransferase involved in cell wall biosynthesis